MYVNNNIMIETIMVEGETFTLYDVHNNIGMDRLYGKSNVYLAYVL